MVSLVSLSCMNCNPDYLIIYVAAKLYDIQIQLGSAETRAEN